MLFVCTQSSFLLTPDIHPGTFLYTSIHRGHVTNEYTTIFHEQILYFPSFLVTVFTVKQNGRHTMDAAGSILEDFSRILALENKSLRMFWEMIEMIILQWDYVD